MAHQKVCDNCHDDFESRRSDARFCTSACKAEFHRNGGPRPLPSVTVRNRPPHGDAENHDYVEVPRELYNEIVQTHALFNDLMLSGAIDPSAVRDARQKKSELEITRLPMVAPLSIENMPSAFAENVQAADPSEARAAFSAGMGNLFGDDDDEWDA